jgi:uncharacterized small protein (DUF1192 family)
MDEITQTVGFRATAQEIAKIDAEAKAAGLSRADYARNKVIAPPNSASTDKLEALLRYIIFGLNRIHIAIYLMAEQPAKTGEPLTLQDLKNISLAALTETLEMMAEFDQRIGQTQAEIAEFVVSRNKLKKVAG